MKKQILNFLRPYVLQIIKEHLVVVKSKNRSAVSDVSIDDKPKPIPPIDPYPPIVP